VTCTGDASSDVQSDIAAIQTYLNGLGNKTRSIKLTKLQVSYKIIFNIYLLIILKYHLIISEHFFFIPFKI